MSYLSITQILIYCLILILSLLITRILAVLREEKLRATLTQEIKKELQIEQESITQGKETLRLQQEQLYKERDEWFKEHQKQSDFVRDCYRKAEQAALNAKSIREEAKAKIAVLENKNRELEQQLKNARQNIKRRKKQLNELKE